MIVKAIKTPIVKKNEDIFKFIKVNVKEISEKSVLVVTSKILSYAENVMVKKIKGNQKEKHELVKKEADYWVDPHSSQFNIMLTIKNNTLAVNGGIDESNSIDDEYILWPKDLQKWANNIWQYLREEYGLEKVGVVITDSRSMPLRWGQIGTSIAHCGLRSMKDLIGHKDIFGRELKMTRINVAEAIAVAAVVEMGEADDCKPLALVINVTNAEFTDTVPSKLELAEEKIELKDDAYYPILKTARWQKRRE